MINKHTDLEFIVIGMHISPLKTVKVHFNGAIKND